MKKIAAIALRAALFMSSCAQSNNCPAYGTTRLDTPKVKRG
jgi:PBP1b-binding outer membrane lipoprotein LpoB